MFPGKPTTEVIFNPYFHHSLTSHSIDDFLAEAHDLPVVRDGGEEFGVVVVHADIVDQDGDVQTLEAVPNRLVSLQATREVHRDDARLHAVRGFCMSYSGHSNITRARSW